MWRLCSPGRDGIQMQWVRVSDVGLTDGAVTGWSQCTRLVAVISTTVIQTGSNRASEDDEDYSTFPTPTGYGPAVVCEHWRCPGEVTDDMIVSIEYGVPEEFWHSFGRRACDNGSVVGSKKRS